MLGRGGVPWLGVIIVAFEVVFQFFVNVSLYSRGVPCMWLVLTCTL